MGYRTVYFLGAGASKALFGLPTMVNFFDKFSAENYPALSDFLRNYFVHSNEIAQLNSMNTDLKENELEKIIRNIDLNLEEVVTALNLSLDRFGSFGNFSKGYILDASNDFNNYITDRLKIDLDDIDMGEKFKFICNKTKNLFEKISRKPINNEHLDSIITLNYDLGMDYILYNFAEKGGISSPDVLKPGTLLHRMYEVLNGSAEITGYHPTLYFKEKDYGFYIKLHGSLDWLYCINEKCENNKLFFPNRVYHKDFHNNKGDPCILCGSPLSIAIVPPTLHKSFEKFPKLGLLWSLAHKRLQEAEKIIIFGVSFSPSDYYLNWLFRSSIGQKRFEKPEIIVIDIDSSVCNKVGKIVGIKPIYKNSIDEYLQSCKN